MSGNRNEEVEEITQQFLKELEEKVKYDDLEEDEEDFYKSMELETAVPGLRMATVNPKSLSLYFNGAILRVRIESGKLKASVEQKNYSV